MSPMQEEEYRTEKEKSAKLSAENAQLQKQLNALKEVSGPWLLS